MRKNLQVVIDQNAILPAIGDYLKDLDNTLSSVLDELNEATEENAVEVCKKVAAKLDTYFQAL